MKYYYMESYHTTGILAVLQQHQQNFTKYMKDLWQPP